MMTAFSMKWTTRSEWMPCLPRQSVARILAVLACLYFSSLPASTAADEEDPYVLQAAPALAGRWDLTVTADDGSTYPSWLEVERSGYRTLTGRYVGQFGSARPVAKVHFESRRGTFHFSIPPQWERRTEDIRFEGRLEDDVIHGTTTDDAGRTIHWKGVRAPSLLPKSLEYSSGEPVLLFNGSDLTGWKARHADVPNGWVVRDGLLVNEKPGNDILTRERFSDFRVQLEFRYPGGSNSGIYLRGRYEVQIEDNYRQSPSSHRIGGVYGYLTPWTNAARPAGEWQTLDITLIGRVVTVVLNDQVVIDRQVIPGITGGALDSEENEPGPLLIQGDHGPVQFRKAVLIPLTPDKD